jgi:hypothetical protein
MEAPALQVPEAGSYTSADAKGLFPYPSAEPPVMNTLPVEERPSGPGHSLPERRGRWLRAERGQLDHPEHLDALKRAYERFPEIGGRSTP